MSLRAVKAVTGPSSPGKERYDDQLLQLLESTSRQVREFTNRHFHTIENATRFFSGDGSRRLFAPDVDVLESIEIDGAAIALSDVVPYPWNSLSNLGLERIANGVFPCGIRNVKITGSWGYPNYLDPRGFTLTTSSSALTAVVSSTAHKLSAGDTLRCGTEQLYVTGVTAARSLTVLRAMHGSIAETHTGAAIRVYRYPEDLALAIGTQVRRWQTPSADRLCR